MSYISVFFYPRKWKVPEKPFFVPVFSFFLRWKYFSSPLLHKSSRAIRSFIRYILRFYHGLNLVFLRQKLRNFKVFFYFWKGKCLLFFPGIFSSRVEFCCFYSGIIFSSRVVFKILSWVKKIKLCTPSGLLQFSFMYQKISANSHLPIRSIFQKLSHTCLPIFWLFS